MPKEQTRELDHLIDELPPHVQDTFLKLLEKAAEDPATLRQVTTQIKWSSYRGDLPPAEVFGEYEREYPGSGAWLLDRITSQSNKRLDIAQLQAEGQEDRANRAQWMGLAVAITGMALSAFAHVLTGSWVFPSILAIASVGGPSTLPILAKALHKYIGKDDESK